MVNSSSQDCVLFKVSGAVLRVVEAEETSMVVGFKARISISVTYK